LLRNQIAWTRLVAQLVSENARHSSKSEAIAAETPKFTELRRGGDTDLKPMGGMQTPV